MSLAGRQICWGKLTISGQPQDFGDNFQLISELGRVASGL
jgi:hypothetical protein